MLIRRASELRYALKLPIAKPSTNHGPDVHCLLWQMSPLVAVLLINFNSHSPVVAGLHVVDLNLNYIQIQNKAFCSKLRLLWGSRGNIFMPRRQRSRPPVQYMYSTCGWTLACPVQMFCLKECPCVCSTPAWFRSSVYGRGQKGSFHRPIVTSRQRIVRGVEWLRLTPFPSRM